LREILAKPYLARGAAPEPLQSPGSPLQPPHENMKVENVDLVTVIWQS